MFWGLIMEPQRRYTQVVKKPFHISMAALDVSTSSDEPSQVMCGVEGRNYLLCTLHRPDVMQCALDLNFEAGDELSLAANGKCHVHLTGYIVDEEPNDLLGEEEEEEVEEEQEEEVKKKNKKRNKLELQNGPPSKKVKSQQEESEEEDDSDVDVTSLLEKTLDSDEEDDTYNSNDEEGEEEEDEDEAEEEEESCLSEDEVAEEPIQVQKTKANITPKKQEQQSPKLQKNKKTPQQNKDKNSSIEESQSPKKESPKKVHVQGVMVEDIREGQGQPAKSGKFVTVYYEGRLKNTNKVFDSTRQGKGFTFRLGGGEVIKGWDVGLVGMKIGGKRKITIPPNMGYGAKGSPPTIPGNSTLVFDVELRKIR